MGLRFRKSVKIVPGVKLNLNKKSTSVTLGTKGIHHTVNSNGKRTTSIGVPGTGLSYSTINSGKKRRNLLISSGITLVSFIMFCFIATRPSPDLTGIKAEWTANEYDINDSIEVKISPIPSTADIESLTLSENTIASLEDKDGKAIVSFMAEGSEELHFIANKEISSDPQLIKVINKKAEAERIAQEKAEAERIAQEQAEAERIAQEQAAAQAQNSANSFNTYDNAGQQQTTSSYVLNKSTKKFLSPGCRDVKKIAPQNYSTYDDTRESIINQGYSPCGHCKL